MEFVQDVAHDMRASLLNQSDGFFVEPCFLHLFSASCHILFLVALSLLWLCRRSSGGGLSIDRSKGDRFLYYKVTVSTCLMLCLFYILLCIYDVFWNGDGKGAFVKEHATQLDLGVRAITWLAIAAYLHFSFLPCGENKFPAVLKIWWGVYLLISFASIALDFFYYGKLGIMGTHMWLLDFGSLISALILNYTGLFGKRVEDGSNHLQESLLNGGVISPNGESSESDGGIGNVSLYTNASFLSILTFSWMNPLFAVGNKKTLGLKDVPQLDHRDSVDVDGFLPIFKGKLEACKATSGDDNNSGTAHLTSFNLAKSLILSSWRLVLLTSIYALLYTVASYVGPYLIDYFVQFLNGYQAFANEGYVLVMTFIIAKIFECLTERHWYFRLQQIGMRVRSFLVSIIYRKGLNLSSNARQGRTSGEIINIMSVDADRVAMIAWYLHDLWMIPVQVALALFVLYARLGLASLALAALAATFVVMLANFPLGKMQEKYQEKVMEAKDVRMKSTSEILRNMRILKLQGWEMKFLAKIAELRKNETNWLKKYVYTSAMTTFVFWGTPSFVAVVTFGACVLMGIPLESGKVLSALATFRVLQEPIYNLPDTISMVVQTKVSLDRITSFLHLEDLQKNIVERLPREISNVAIEVSNGMFSWDLSSESPTLKDLNFKILDGMRVAVCGTVGSGKSSLLACILGEVPKIAGTVKLCGSTAYVAQSPWIQSGKIQDNILFGKEMDSEKYNNVLEACSLKKDLEILPFGDQTIIGERGINLSGGQKQRVQIARALYQDADIFLFDDPFSAVDAHTGSHLFKECLLGVLASKTIVYVTHQVEFLPTADLILVMKDGMITEMGKYNDIITSGRNLMELVGAHKEALSVLVNMELAKDNSSNIEDDSSANSKSSEQTLDEAKKDAPNSKADETEIQKGQLVQEEEREKGRVGFWVYWKYITKAYKGALVPLILCAQMLFQVLQIASNYWMAWAAPPSRDVEAPVTVLTLIYIYIALAIGSSICILIRALLLATAGLKTATILFNEMHFSIFRAPMSFFDSTPSGRILNRASSDQSDVDTSIPNQIAGFAFAIIQFIGIILVMSQVAWQVFIIFIPVVGLSFWYQQYYIDTARELARLVGGWWGYLLFKAPIIQHFSESLSGSTTIRSFGEESRFINTNSQRLDECNRSRFHINSAMQWLSFHLELLSTIVFAFCLVFLICLPKGVIDPGLAGLAVTYGLTLNTLQAWVIWTLCSLENKIIAVERIFQYTNISSEPPLVIETNRPDGNWPSKGDLELHDLQVRYAPHLPFVLKGLTCNFPGGLKTGIVGRTGSGKSTLIQTLFRIIDPTVGEIIIDGINISTIGLHDLRSKLSIIPQDPTMFEGTVRSNLDPLEEHTDEQIWEALDCCQLGDEVRKKENKLDSIVTENGENWSVGQRQLVCLGRVILKRSKVLVLDEATASVDTATDNLIQKTLRQQFSDSTVITVAHRITSVLDSDIVLLLDDGLIIEHDSPTRLLENKSSMFAKLVAEYSVRSNSSFDELDNS
ncbi:LOW QUALITY PROTEIN: ABC transporter C family member 3-like [Phalaenopsis equestris]|uniref:LOW QUALITY PROTEIN: ABC transporter C family member 3-like n=1 Tax=Phalaenopsis equestris TaxID=78828 RepID=UPI0009E6078E|nr:LOW QUALITY PROTEIN: ABC transporter C family member 3-like [Phalaenopsis equestris]